MIWCHFECEHRTRWARETKDNRIQKKKEEEIDEILLYIYVYYMCDCNQLNWINSTVPNPDNNDNDSLQLLTHQDNSKNSRNTGKFE